MRGLNPQAPHRPPQDLWSSCAAMGSIEQRVRPPQDLRAGTQRESVITHSLANRYSSYWKPLTDTRHNAPALLDLAGTRYDWFVTPTKTGWSLTASPEPPTTPH